MKIKKFFVVMGLLPLLFSCGSNNNKPINPINPTPGEEIEETNVVVPTNKNYSTSAIYYENADYYINLSDEIIKCDQYEFKDDILNIKAPGIYELSGSTRV